CSTSPSEGVTRDDRRAWLRRSRGCLTPGSAGIPSRPWYAPRISGRRCERRMSSANRRLGYPLWAGALGAAAVLGAIWLPPAHAAPSCRTVCKDVIKECRAEVPAATFCLHLRKSLRTACRRELAENKKACRIIALDTCRASRGGQCAT